MAIDTENKRRSTLHILPAPDNSIDTQDRPQVIWIYAGLVISVVVAVPLTAIASDAEVFSAVASDAEMFSATASDAAVFSAIASDAAGGA